MASQAPFPFLPPKSTELRMAHFDENIYKVYASGTTNNTLLFRFLDALCGDAGASSLKKEVFLQRLSGALDGIYGTDLDYVFGNVRFLSRANSEAYPYDPMKASLTSKEWDVIATKDAQYRSRIKEFFQACTNAGTDEAIRKTVHAAVSSDCQVLENWRYIDNFGISDPLGRASAISYVAINLTNGHQVMYVMVDNMRDYFTTSEKAQDYIDTLPVDQRSNWQVQPLQARSEVTVVPHKQNLTPRETRLLTQMLDRIKSVDTVITVDPNGLSVHSPITVQAITADSTYYQVEKVVTGTPLLDQLPAPELLAIDIDPTEQWLNPRSPELAPYGQFNITQEYGYFYLVSGGSRSPIDSVNYGVLQDDGTVKAEPDFEYYEQNEQYGPWTTYEKADSPDNYPGGRFGLTPAKEPALNPDRSPYQFVYTSQDEYVAARKAEVIRLGGEANDQRYRLPAQKTSNSKRIFTPDLAIAYTAPTRESTVTSGWTSRRPRYMGTQLRDPRMFTRG